MARLRLVIERYGESRFTSWGAITAKTDDHAPRTTDSPGFRRKLEHDAGDELYTSATYYVLSATWSAYVFKGMNPRTVNGELVLRGILAPAADGRASQAMSLPGMPKVPAYLVSAGILPTD